MLTQDELKEMFNYDPVTGSLTWAINRGKRWKAGGTAGYQDPRGYVTVEINKARFKAHRIIWTMMNGVIPEGLCIDHIDGNPSNNSLANLRLATWSQNLANQGKRINKTGFKGVRTDGKKFTAQISLGFNLKKHLGSFKTAVEAALAYDQEAIAMFGEFAKTNAMMGRFDGV